MTRPQHRNLMTLAMPVGHRARHHAALWRARICAVGGWSAPASFRKPAAPALFEAMMRAERIRSSARASGVIRDAERSAIPRQRHRDGDLRSAVAAAVRRLFYPAPRVRRRRRGWSADPVFAGAADKLTTRAGVEATSRLSTRLTGFAAKRAAQRRSVRGLGMGDTVLERWCGQQAAAVASNARAQERSAVLVAASRFCPRDSPVRHARVRRLVCSDRRDIAGVIMAAAQSFRARARAGRAGGRPMETHHRLPQRLSPPEAPVRPASAAEAMFQLQAPVGHVRVEKPSWCGRGQPACGARREFDLAAGGQPRSRGRLGERQSSLARALAGVWPLTSGDPHRRRRAHQWDPNKLGKHVGYLPQDVELSPARSPTNIARLGAANHAAVVAAAKLAGAHDVITRLPQGLRHADRRRGMALWAACAARRSRPCTYGAAVWLFSTTRTPTSDEEASAPLAQAIAPLAGRALHP